MEDKKNILLISRDENCATEVMEFLLKSKWPFEFDGSSGLNDPATATDYAYKGGPPTVIEGSGCNDLRVYCVLTSLNTIKSHMSEYEILTLSRYNAVIMYLEDDNADNFNWIIDYIQSQSYLNYHAQENEWDWKKSHNLTIIGNYRQLYKLRSIKELLGFELSSWIWNGKFACNWSTHRCIINNLWIHINKYNYNTTRVFYISEIMLQTITNMFVFFRQFVIVLYDNIYCIEHGTEADELYILTCYGDTYRRQTKLAKDLLNQFNILTMSDFAKLLKEEITQLARHLSRLAILCGEILKIENSDLLPHFSLKKEFILGYQEEKKFFARIGELFAINSLDAMSEMKYTGIYIKDVLGIEVLNSLKSCLENFPNFRNTRIDSLSVPSTAKNDPLGNKGRGKQESQSENRTQDILVEDRIGNIQLLKSLQNTLQEFTDELKKVRELQEYNTEVVTKEIKIIKEKLKNNCSCNHLNQKLDEDRSRTKE